MLLTPQDGELFFKLHRALMFNGTPLTGRGWARFDGKELNGMMYIHLGDDSEFIAKRINARA